jgi:esterase FrsA
MQMHDVDELKQFVLGQAPIQGISRRRCLDVCTRIQHDDRGLPRSWVWEWRAVGERLERQGQLLDAYRHYSMASFPYIDGGARQYTADRALSAFNRWRSGQADVRRLDVDLGQGQVRCWTSGLSATGRKPLLLIMDGITTVKERWVPLLADARRLGMAGIVTEMPGVGENTLCYDADSWRMLSAIIDAVSGQADVAETYALTPSFSGHLALRCAADDTRIRGVITAGAPVNRFFTSAPALQGSPRFIRDTLAHMTGATTDDVTSRLRDLALTDQLLAMVDVPVYYMADRSERLVPSSEISCLERNVRDLCLLEGADAGGAPWHSAPWQSAEARLWTALSILRMRGVRGMRRAAVSTMWRANRAHHVIARTL